jgi:hypothetical protein
MEAPMGPMVLKFKKKADAGTILTCVRSDGSSTSDDLGESRGFGPMHDLCHYVVERWFGFREGFLGLLGSGWDIRDFEVPGTAATLPHEAGQAEWLAGMLGLDYGAGQGFDTDAYYMAYEGTFRKSWPETEPHEVTQEDLVSIRTELKELLHQWSQVPVNETMEVGFDPAAPPRRDAADQPA